MHNVCMKTDDAGAHQQWQGRPGQGHARFCCLGRPALQAQLNVKANKTPAMPANVEPCQSPNGVVSTDSSRLVHTCLFQVTVEVCCFLCGRVPTTRGACAFLFFRPCTLLLLGFLGKGAWKLDHSPRTSANTFQYCHAVMVYGYASGQSHQGFNNDGCPSDRRITT